VQVFHAGTSLVGGLVTSSVRTSGGRVLGVTAAADTLPEALDLVYSAMGKIEFEGKYFRRDIGHRALLKQWSK